WGREPAAPDGTRCCGPVQVTSAPEACAPSAAGGRVGGVRSQGCISTCVQVSDRCGKIATTPDLI
ncbi:MAG: hypothetical protein ACUVUA_16190, partial [Chloroflexus sp.]|uniref:hypothetical protein n=1 Tax=Chloroflexus sp. TaxID=1904827 RepID=UPI00404AE247